MKALHRHRAQPCSLAESPTNRRRRQTSLSAPVAESVVGRVQGVLSCCTISEQRAKNRLPPTVRVRTEAGGVRVDDRRYAGRQPFCQPTEEQAHAGARAQAPASQFVIGAANTTLPAWAWRLRCAVR